MALYEIWVECKNNELCEEIERQRNKLIAIIKTIEEVQ